MGTSQKAVVGRRHAYAHAYTVRQAWSTSHEETPPHTNSVQHVGGEVVVTLRQGWTRRGGW